VTFSEKVRAMTSFASSWSFFCTISTLERIIASDVSGTFPPGSSKLRLAQTRFRFPICSKSLRYSLIGRPGKVTKALRTGQCLDGFPRMLCSRVESLGYQPYCQGHFLHSDWEVQNYLACRKRTDETEHGQHAGRHGQGDCRKTPT
jgi:hypothetical protein